MKPFKSCLSSCLKVLALQVLASIGQLEFFYDQAPDIMRSCSMALQLLSVAVGSYLSGAVVAALGSITARLGFAHGQGWLPKDMNHGRLDLFFLFLACKPSWRFARHETAHSLLTACSKSGPVFKAG